MLHHALRRTPALHTRLGLVRSVGPPSAASAVSATRRSLTTASTASDETAPASGDFAVLGGGITGLATAYYLSKAFPQQNITVYEASDRLGGWLSSKRVPVKNGSILFEAGPRSLRPAGNGILSARLLQELDLAKDAIFPQNTSPAARNRYIYYPDHLVRMPHPSHGLAENLWSLLTEPAFKGFLGGFFNELTRPPRHPSVADESIGAFISRRTNANLVDRLASAVFHGIYAGDVYQLSARSLMSAAWKGELREGGLVKNALKARAEGQEVTKREADFLVAMKDFEWDPLLAATIKNSTVFTFREGLGMLSDRMVERLVESGNVEFKTSTPIKSVQLSNDRTSVDVKTSTTEESKSYSQVVSALSPAHLNAIRPDTNVVLIPEIPTVTVMTVGLFYRTPNLAPDGFGYLIPRATPFENNPERALGVVFDNACSPSPESLDMNNWQIDSAEHLQQARERGQLVNINDFAWYNMPDRPNMQDDLNQGGTKLTVMLGGHWWDGWPAYPDDQEGLALAKSVVARHLNIKEDPEVYQVRLQRDCIPQYTVGHDFRLMEAHDNLKSAFNGRLCVAGNWINGVGVNDALRSAWEVVRNLKEKKNGTGLEHIGAPEQTVRMKVTPMGAQAEAGERGPN